MVDQLGHLQISVRYKALKNLWNKDFFNLVKFEFLVKNDRSAVDIRNRPRIPVPDEVKAFDDDAHDDDYDHDHEMKMMNMVSKTMTNIPLDLLISYDNVVQNVMHS